MDLDMLLKDRLVENFNKEKEKLGENEFPCTKEELEEFGYNTMMVFVNTTDTVSKQRNEKLTRMMYESVRHSKWTHSQNNKSIYKDNFENFVQIDNNKTIEQIEEDIDLVYKKINKFFVFESSKPKLIKLDQDKADTPSDITPDNRGGSSQHGDDVKSNTPAMKNPNKTYTFKTYSESAPTLKVSPQPKESNFSMDNDKRKVKKRGDTSLRKQNLIKPSGIGREYDTRAGGQSAAAGAGLGNQTYSESQEYSDASPASTAFPSGGSVNPLSSDYNTKNVFLKKTKKLKSEAIENNLKTQSLYILKLNHEKFHHPSFSFLSLSIERSVYHVTISTL